MSGGVDSSVTTALLKEQGHQVIGLTLQLLPSESPSASNSAVADARRVAEQLGITHRVLETSDIFAQQVIANFCEQYLKGRTPNPCVRCNQHIKFGRMLDEAKTLGADFVATGHYTKVERIGKRYVLRKGADPAKDQSYFLYTLRQDQLAHILMPLGSYTKDEVRRIAREIGLAATERPESQEICFVPDNDYPAFVQRHVPQIPGPGPIIDAEGGILGEHRGIIHYTIGQRRGLGIAASAPLSVTAIDPKRNTIIVGFKNEVASRALIAANINWIGTESPREPFEVSARIRYRHKEAKATVVPLTDGRVRVEFKQPQMAVTPGQSAVFYKGDQVLGGGTIDQAVN